MSNHHQVNYIELPSCDISRTKAFFSAVFDWTFVDYGPDYCSFSQGIDGGFYRADLVVDSNKGSPLLVLYSDDLAATQARVEQAGGSVIKPIFDFPGGRRFHFTDPNGSEFAVWSNPA